MVEPILVTISVDTNTITNKSKDNIGDDLKEIIINITDSGKGIDHELLPRLFSKSLFKDGTFFYLFYQS
jgi:signal transduction histidine kinase